MEDREAILRLRKEKKAAAHARKLAAYEKKKERIKAFKPAPARAAVVPPPPQPKPAVPAGDPPLNDALKKWAVGAPSFMGFVVDKQHLNMHITEVFEQPDMKGELDKVKSEWLLEMLKSFSEEQWAPFLQHGCSYYGDQVYKTAASMEYNLKAIVTYAETDAKAASDIKLKLRFVAKSVKENPDTLGVVVMLAAHGGVCNVQKEIGVRLAYSALADSGKSECDVNDPKNKILMLLYDLRELCVENLYHAQALNGYKSVNANAGPAINSHNLFGYRNEIAADIGLKIVPDPNTSNNATARRYLPAFFERFYTIEVLVEHIFRALNENPRKLPYNSVVSFLEYNRPKKFGDDKEEFLFHCFDVSGNFTRGCVAWIL